MIKQPTYAAVQVHRLSMLPAGNDEDFDCCNSSASESHTFDVLVFIDKKLLLPTGAVTPLQLQPACEPRLFFAAWTSFCTTFVFLGREHTESYMAQWIRRRACDHLVSRSNPDIGLFLFVTFLFFMEPPIGVRELARVFDSNIYWPWICSRRMHVSSKHVFSKYVFSKYVFSKRMFSTFCLFRNVSIF